MASKTQSIPQRVTVTLASGQREDLLAIARKNGTTLAFVVRYAVAQFLSAGEDQQLKFEYPKR